MRKVFRLENLGCASCADKMASSLTKLPGIDKATISFMTQKLVVEGDEETLNPTTLVPQINKVCQKFEKDCCVAGS